jgi:hypothetical protein
VNLVVFVSFFVVRVDVLMLVPKLVKGFILEVFLRRGNGERLHFHFVRVVVGMFGMEAIRSCDNSGGGSAGGQFHGGVPYRHALVKAPTRVSGIAGSSKQDEQAGRASTKAFYIFLL